jgi:glyoxylase-like metal-dependent hydrolase (beta-lactamase superfamily II)
MTVIDTGLPGNADRIMSYVESLGRQRTDIKMIILTHPDIDHAGSVARLRIETHSKVGIHEADAPRLSGEKQLKEVRGALGLFLRAMGVFMQFEPVNADLLLKDSDHVDELTVVHTPGHTEGSICLYLPKNAVFVGDALATDNQRKLSLPRKSMSVDLSQAKESVKKIALLEFSVLLPGHGPPIEQNASMITREFAARL